MKKLFFILLFSIPFLAKAQNENTPLFMFIIRFEAVRDTLFWDVRDVRDATVQHSENGRDFTDIHFSPNIKDSFRLERNGYYRIHSANNYSYIVSYTKQVVKDTVRRIYFYKNQWTFTKPENVPYYAFKILKQ